jgi:hypothetical protein
MRDYDPTTGRYLQADPLGLVDGASVYGYVRQSPMMLTDPRGLWVVGPQSRRVPDYSPYTDDLMQCDSDDCFDEWMKNQDACRSKHDAGMIADKPACLERARNIFERCMSGGGGPPLLPWSAHDEDVPKPGPKKPVRYGQPPAKPGITSSVGVTIGAILTGILVITGSLVFG